MWRSTLKLLNVGKIQKFITLLCRQKIVRFYLAQKNEIYRPYNFKHYISNELIYIGVLNRSIDHSYQL